MIEILPSILSADFAELARDVHSVTRAGASMIHFDVMDGHFVPNVTIGPPVLKSLRKHTQATIDVHLMVSNPDTQVPWFLEAGANCISVHQEAAPHLDRTLNQIQQGGALAGVVLNPATSVELLRPILHVCDYVLIMSVNPGFGGQVFLPYTLNKVRWLAEERQRQGLDFKIEIDGGINAATVSDAIRAGVDWVVAGSAIFGAPDPGDEYRHLRKLALDAASIQA